MTPRFLLDTHVLLRWLGDSKRLSRQQRRTLEQVAARGEPVGLSAMSLLEIAILGSDGHITVRPDVNAFFLDLEGNPLIRILPLSAEIAVEAGSLRGLRDPADRVIVAAARVHGMQLLTSDERILRSGLARTIG